jgi:hypothetical protein
MKNLKDPIGNRTRDLPVCGTVRQRTALSITPLQDGSFICNCLFWMKAIGSSKTFFTLKMEAVGSSEILVQGSGFLQNSDKFLCGYMA